MTQKESFSITSSSPEETSRIGNTIGSTLRPGQLITLQGTLGAGKTNLVQAIAEAMQIDRKHVVSPTFTMIQIHQGLCGAQDCQLVHIDAYRIADEDQYLELGIDEYIESDAIVAMEWGEKFVELLPRDRLDILIDVTSEKDRRLSLSWSENSSESGAPSESTQAGRRLRDSLLGD